jgi:hypothetical protein
MRSRPDLRAHAAVRTADSAHITSVTSSKVAPGGEQAYLDGVAVPVGYLVDAEMPEPR